MRRNSVSSITYGALFTALVGVLVYINRILANSLEVYFFWIVPVVIVVYRCKFDLRDTIMTSFAMILLTSILSGIISTTTFYMIASIIAGIVYAQGFINGRSATFLICSVILISLVVMIVSTFLFASFFGYDVAEEYIGDGKPLFTTNFKDLPKWESVLKCFLKCLIKTLF